MYYLRMNINLLPESKKRDKFPYYKYGKSYTLNKGRDYIAYCTS